MKEIKMLSLIEGWTYIKKNLKTQFLSKKKRKLINSINGIKLITSPILLDTNFIKHIISIPIEYTDD